MADRRDALLPADGVARSVLAIHAHPDDETLATGLALARAVLLGGRAHVITCTLGEEGEVIPADLAHLEGAPELARYRHGELHGAITALGATHSYLGGGAEVGVGGAELPEHHGPRWRDSGMAGTTSAQHPRAFLACDIEEAAALLEEDIRTLAPDLLLTYDPTGGYQHPDHIRTHQVTLAAWRRLPAEQRPELFIQLTPLSWVRQDRADLADLVDPEAGLHIPQIDDEMFSGVVADAEVSHEVSDPAAAQVRDRALTHHRTQVEVFDGYYALSNKIAARLTDREGYTRVG